MQLKVFHLRPARCLCINSIHMLALKPSYGPKVTISEPLQLEANDIGMLMFTGCCRAVAWHTPPAQLRFAFSPLT